MHHWTSSFKLILYTAMYSIDFITWLSRTLNWTEPNFYKWCFSRNHIGMSKFHFAPRFYGIWVWRFSFRAFLSWWGTNQKRGETQKWGRNQRHSLVKEQEVDSGGDRNMINQCSLSGIKGTNMMSPTCKSRLIFSESIKIAVINPKFRWNYKYFHCHLLCS